MTIRPTASSQVRAYFADKPARAQRALRAIRGAVKKAAPDAVEHFSYRIPGFKLDGRPLVWYAAFANHCSLYPIGEQIRRAHTEALRSFATSKGTVRFPLEAAMPTALIGRLVKARVAQLRSR